MNQKIGVILSILVFCQLLFSLVVTGQYVIFNSNLKLWLSPDYFYFEKINMMLGGDYVFSRRVGDIPRDANCLAVSDNILWFANYYLFPRKLFWYEGVTKEADLKKVPEGWIKERKIEYVLLYQLPDVRFLKLGKQ